MDFENINIRAKSEYPKIVDSRVDAETVGILKNLISNYDGELNAILTYTYQHIMSEQIAKDISKIIEEVAMIEMKHLGMLSEAIVCFGGVPKYTNGKGQFYSAGCVNYTMKLSEILNANVASESGAVKAYRASAERVSNASLKALLLRIAEDEELHLKVFEELRRYVVFYSL